MADDDALDALDCLLVEGDAALALFNFLRALSASGEAIRLDDVAGYAASTFLSIGEDRQAILCPMLEALRSEHGERFWVREDPLAGANQKLTAEEEEHKGPSTESPLLQVLEGEIRLRQPRGR